MIVFPAASVTIATVGLLIPPSSTPLVHPGIPSCHL